MFSSTAAPFKFNFGGGNDDVEMVEENDDIKHQPIHDTTTTTTATTTITTSNIVPATIFNPFTIPITTTDPMSYLTQYCSHYESSSPSLKFIPLTIPASPSITLYRRDFNPSTSLDSSILRDITISHDVVKSVYEGGFKIWECAIDCIMYLMEQQQQQQQQQETSTSHFIFDATRTLDLGCGHGLIGIHLLHTHSPCHVTFQDLNHEVLKHVTVPNVIYNNVKDMIATTKYVSGDWTHHDMIPSLIGKQDKDQQDSRFTLIVTSDTLYSEASMRALLHILKKCLSPKGHALVAAKRYYFGIGGSTSAFSQLVDHDGTMSCHVVRIFEDGQSNIREILCITHKRQDNT